MTQPATPETVLAPFDGVELELEGKTYRLSQDGDEFWVEMPDPDLESLLLQEGKDLATADVPTVRRQVVLLTGSHYLQDYWVASRDQKGLYHVPWEYHIAERRWIPFTDAHLIPPGEKRGVSHWNSSCIACHSVGGVPGLDPETDHWSSRVAEFGVACESCHGPAEQHVAHHQNPLNRYRERRRDEPDPTIVNPANCSHETSAAICGQCHATFHMTNDFGEPDLLSFLMRGSRYRAGDDLANHVRMLSMHPPGENDALEAFRNLYYNERDARDALWPDGAARVGGREYLGLLDSPCYLDGAMSCLSCHSMHESDPDAQLATRMEGNHGCVQCHETIGDDVAAHTHHAPDSAGSLCYNCHMPHTSIALLRAARSHRIDSPDVASSVRTGRPNGCNLCHLDQTLEWSSQRLSDWYGAEPAELNEEERTIAASLLWLLTGNAAQREVVAWHMGWSPALEVSGPVGWQAPFLARLLNDPYSAVRYMAGRSLRRLPGFEDLEYDYVGVEPQRLRAERRVQEQFTRSWSGGRPETVARLLLEVDGGIRQDRVEDLLERRDDQPVRIKE